MTCTRKHASILPTESCESYKSCKNPGSGEYEAYCRQNLANLINLVKIPVQTNTIPVQTNYEAYRRQNHNDHSNQWSDNSLVNTSQPRFTESNISQILQKTSKHLLSAFSGIWFSFRGKKKFTLMVTVDQSTLQDNEFSLQ